MIIGPNEQNLRNEIAKKQTENNALEEKIKEKKEMVRKMNEKLQQAKEEFRKRLENDQEENDKLKKELEELKKERERRADEANESKKKPAGNEGPPRGFERRREVVLPLTEYSEIEQDVTEMFIRLYSRGLGKKQIENVDFI